MKWTSRRIWLHPKRALKRIEEAENTENDLQQRLDEALSLLEKESKESASLSLRVAELTQSLAEAERHLADELRKNEDTKLRLREALDSLDAYKSIDDKMADFNQELKKVETVKRGYEKRITELEARLAAARKRLGEADDKEMLESIDMIDGSRRQSIHHSPHGQPYPSAGEPKDNSSAKTADDWLSEPPAL